MTKMDLVNSIYYRHGGLLRREAFNIIESLLKILRNRLIQGEEIKISNFGVLCLKKRKGGRVKNPNKADEIIEIPPHNSLIFRPAKHLIKILNSQ